MTTNSNINYLEKLAELTEYLSRENPNIDIMCEYIKIRSFAHLNPVGMFISRLLESGNIETLATCGFSPEIKDKWRESSINDEMPVSDALKTNSLIWISNEKDWHREYPNMVTQSNNNKLKTFITWPISARNSSMCVMGVLLSEQKRPSPDSVSYFQAIGSLVAIQISRISISSINVRVEDVIKLLTRRQREILHWIAEGLTNLQIANDLGFSESTIRQETMRMYEILQVAGRKEAISKYNTSSLRYIS